MFKQFTTSLLSRKFLLTLAGAVALYQAAQYGEMVVLLIGFLGVQGGADLVAKYQGRTLTAIDVETAVSQNDEYAIDRTKIETGKPEPMPLLEHESSDK